MAPTMRIYQLSTLVCVIGASLCLWANISMSQNSATRGAVTRLAQIHDVEHIDDHRLRLIFSAQERDGTNRFPITTIDRSMVKVDFTNTSSPPAEPKSLLLHGAGGTELKRALYVSFSPHSKLSKSVVDELRSQVGELVKQLPSEYLTVAAISQDSARIIGDVNPEKGDNVNRIRQQLQTLEPEGEGPALADTLCVAAERFHAWDLSKFRKGDQKILVIMSSPGDSRSTDRYRGENCWRSLLDQGVRVFHVAFGAEYGRSFFDLASVAQDSGGYVHRVSGPVEMFAATKNVMALLNNEYVIDVDAPDIAIEDQPLELKLRISYHDEVFESPPFNVGFVIPDLAKVFDAALNSSKGRGKELNSTPPEERPFHWNLIVGTLILVLLLGGMVVSVRKYYKFRSKYRFCETCALYVEKDHSDCPFRRSECIARLVVIGGRHAGQTIPIMKGETLIARFPRVGAKVRGKGIRWFGHGSIKLDGYKALYVPKNFGRDRVNGWLVHEPRLLGVGSILAIGDQKLRFEVKPQAHS